MTVNERKGFPGVRRLGLFLNGLSTGRLVTGESLAVPAFVEGLMQRPPKSWELILQYLVNRFLREAFLHLPVEEDFTIGSGAYLLAACAHELARPAETVRSGWILDWARSIEAPRDLAEALVYHAVLDAYLAVFPRPGTRPPELLGALVDASPLSQAVHPHAPGPRRWGKLRLVFASPDGEGYVIRKLLDLPRQMTVHQGVGALLDELIRPGNRAWGAGVVLRFYEAYETTVMAAEAGRRGLEEIELLLGAEKRENWERGRNWFALYRPLLDLVASDVSTAGVTRLSNAFIDRLAAMARLWTDDGDRFRLERQEENPV